VFLLKNSTLIFFFLESLAKFTCSRCFWNFHFSSDKQQLMKERRKAQDILAQRFFFLISNCSFSIKNYFKRDWNCKISNRWEKASKSFAALKKSEIFYWFYKRIPFIFLASCIKVSQNDIIHWKYFLSAALRIITPLISEYFHLKVSLF